MQRRQHTVFTTSGSPAGSPAPGTPSSADASTPSRVAGAADDANASSPFEAFKKRWERFLARSGGQSAQWDDHREAQLFDDLLDEERTDTVKDVDETADEGKGIPTFYPAVAFEFDICRHRARWGAMELENWFKNAETAWSVLNERVCLTSRINGRLAAWRTARHKKDGSGRCDVTAADRTCDLVTIWNGRGTPVRLMFTAVMAYVNIATVVSRFCWRASRTGAEDDDLTKQYQDAMNSVIDGGIWDINTVLRNLDNLALYAAIIVRRGDVSDALLAGGSGSSRTDGRGSRSAFSAGMRGSNISGDSHSGNMGSNKDGGISRGAGGSGNGNSGSGGNRQSGYGRGSGSYDGQRSSGGSEASIAVLEERWAMLGKVVRVVKIILLTRLARFDEAIAAVAAPGYAKEFALGDLLGRFEGVGHKRGGLAVSEADSIPCVDYIQFGGVLGESLLYHVAYSLLMVGRFTDAVSMITYFLMVALRERTGKGDDRDRGSTDGRSRIQGVSVRYSATVFGSFPVTKVIAVAYSLSPVVRCVPSCLLCVSLFRFSFLFVIVESVCMCC